MAVDKITKMVSLEHTGVTVEIECKPDERRIIIWVGDEKLLTATTDRRTLRDFVIELLPLGNKLFDEEE